MKLKYLILIGLLPAHMALAECRSKMVTNSDGEQVSTSSMVICADGKIVPEIPTRIQIGDTVLENELMAVPEVTPKYFQWRHSKCKLFREKYMYKGKLRLNHGVVCQTDEKENIWQVVDKW